MMTRQLTAILEQDEEGYVAFCPELDIASQGDTVTQVRENLAEALVLFFECASAEEVERRLHSLGGQPSERKILPLYRRD